MARWRLCNDALWVAAALVSALIAACDTASNDPEKPPQPAVSAPDLEAPVTPEPSGPWPRLENDGIHDPTNAALALLQQPEEALSLLPRAAEGNLVDWVAALRAGDIAPRTNIFPETEITVIDSLVVFENTAGMPRVVFPHQAHTEWLDCQNCHDKIFKPVRGANAIGMEAILQGQFCGQCHGAVAFPLTQCLRCHSLPHEAASSGAEPGS